jgi:hypothetical protein
VWVLAFPVLLELLVALELVHAAIGRVAPSVAAVLRVPATALLRCAAGGADVAAWPLSLQWDTANKAALLVGTAAEAWVLDLLAWEATAAPSTRACGLCALATAALALKWRNCVQLQDAVAGLAGSWRAWRPSESKLRGLQP